MTLISLNKADASTRYIGIDIAKSHFDIAIGTKRQRAAYTPAAIVDLIAVWMQMEDPLVLMEASGGYERQLADLLAGAGLAVAIINPRRVRNFARSIGKLGSGPINPSSEASKWQRYRTKIPAGNSHSVYKGILI